MVKVKANKNFASVVRSFQVINLNFFCPIENEFSFGMRDTIAPIYSHQGLLSRMQTIEEIASKLATLIPNMLEYKKNPYCIFKEQIK